MDDVTPLSKQALIEAMKAGRVFEFRPFYGHTPREDGRLSDAVFSQFWPSRFTIDGELFGWAEQWMMASKARLFGDEATRAKIMAVDAPKDCKALGRLVTPYDDERWAAARYDIVVRGSIAKFGQDEALRAYILATGDAVLVKAAPRDLIWGVGYGRDNAAIGEPERWRGRNLLGFALMQARMKLRLQ